MTAGGWNARLTPEEESELNKKVSEGLQRKVSDAMTACQNHRYPQIQPGSDLQERGLSHRRKNRLRISHYGCKRVSPNGRFYRDWEVDP